MSANMIVNEELFPWESEAEAEARRRAEAGEAPPAPTSDAGRAEAGATAADTPSAGQNTPPDAGTDTEVDDGPADASPDEGDEGAVDDDDAYEAARARAELDFEPLAGRDVVPASRERRIAPREYYAISEVCEITGLKPHVLRYWEAQFPLLNPSKNRSGNRVYQRKEIRLILLVKELLYSEKYTVEGAKAKLEQLRGGGELAAATSHALDRHMIQLLRSELRQLAELLTPPRS